MRESLRIFCSKIFWNVLGLAMIALATLVGLAALIFDNSEVSIW